MRPAKSTAPRTHYRELKKKQIWNAMLELLEEKPIKNITIREICDKALIHRTTFYNHFYDIFDLAVYGIRQIAINIGADNDSNDLYEQTDSILFFIKRYKRIFINMCDTEYSDEILKTVGNELNEELLRIIRISEKISKKKIAPEIMAKFFSAGLERMISYWFESELPEDELRAEIFNVLDMIQNNIR